MGPPRRGLACWDASPRRSSRILARQAGLTLIVAPACAVSSRRFAETGCTHRHGVTVLRSDSGARPVFVDESASKAAEASDACCLAWRVASRTPAGIRCRRKSVDWCFTPERGQSRGTISAGPRPKDGRRAADARDYLPLMALAGEGSKSVSEHAKSIIEIKEVAGRSNRLDNVALSASRQCLAQMDDVRIDSSRVDGGAIPYDLDQLFT